MRERVWNNLADIKFKSIYLNKVSNRAYHWGNAYSIFLAVASASSVAAWAVWEKYPALWAAIVAISQILHIIKPYMYFIKNDKEFIEMSLLFEGIYLSYEKLWYELQKEDFNSDEAENTFYENRQKELDISKNHKHVVCPNIASLISKADAETNNFLQAHF